MNNSDNQWKNIDPIDLHKLFKEAAKGSPRDADEFFGLFGHGNLLTEGKYYEALDKGFNDLHYLSKTDRNLYKKIHKGSPYYWIAIAAYRIHDFQTAVYYFDAAVSEDLKSDPENIGTPSRLFLSLEGDLPDQFAQPLTKGAQIRIEEYIDLYNKLRGSNIVSGPLSIEDVREYFLKIAFSTSNHKWRSIATTFISFFLEWDYWMFHSLIRTGGGTTEPFYLHLFKGCLLFESLLKANPTIEPSSGKTLGYVLKELRNHLGLIGKINIGGVNFSDVLSDIKIDDDEISTNIQVLGRLRNTIGHDLGWPEGLNTENYGNLFFIVATSYLHVIATLYRK